MSNLKVFRVRGGQATEVPGAAVGVEVELQRLIEANMEAMLGIRFLAGEYRTGHHGGRIDSLGLDEKGPQGLRNSRTSRRWALRRGPAGLLLPMRTIAPWLPFLLCMCAVSYVAPALSVTRYESRSLHRTPPMAEKRASAARRGKHSG